VFSTDVASFAQVHWDIGAEVGVMQRVTPDRSPGLPLPQAGPLAELHAHVALMPMLRLGAYLAHDISLVEPNRQTTEAGLRAKLTPPLLPRPWRTWTFLDLGYARSYRPSHVLEPTPSNGASGEVGGAEGDFLDAALGFGVGARVRGPWMLFAELAARAGFLFWGAMYDPSPCACLRDPYPGHDSFAASLSVGVSLDL
jgi:hypothetical protein